MMTDATASKGYTTPRALAEDWGVSAKFVRDLIRRGDLRAHAVGSIYIVPHDAVKDYLNRTATAKAA